MTVRPDKYQRSPHGLSFIAVGLDGAQGGREIDARRPHEVVQHDTLAGRDIAQPSEHVLQCPDQSLVPSPQRLVQRGDLVAGEGDAVSWPDPLVPQQDTTNAASVVEGGDIREPPTIAADLHHPLRSEQDPRPSGLSSADAEAVEVVIGGEDAVVVIAEAHLTSDFADLLKALHANQRGDVPVIGRAHKGADALLE